MSDDNTRVAVVTGGGSGIGRATVLRLLEADHRVVVADMNAETAAATAELAAAPDRVAVAAVDVRDEEAVAAALAMAVDRFGGLSAVVNNAGVGGAFGAITEIESADWDYTFEVLVRGVFYGVKHAARIMQAQGRGGSIVNVASVAGLTGGLGPVPYSAAKAAVVNFTKAVSIELAADRIRVNAVLPGAISTPLVHHGRPERAEDKLAATQPWPAAGRPEHIASAISFLAGGESEFVTGEALVVDGGLTAAGPGPAFAERLGNDPRLRGMAGVNHGTTGVPSVVRNRPE
ncbi:MAG: SDR family oxidoreductase [Pseudonocardia sp.]|uniref:SDR family NAD(P)-dependent oxidoreductase n=1 Tax=unclassified Pseudonocardia TaxID=2619320 RepID=UPI00086AD2E1|nr:MULTISPECIES: SDR family oxidoreductase [unclassified Pseudonocardia]MBN9112143.1 SDR family oxidoreductase [Pseudonocardia sp.]ODU26080.1 MAG: short-chain dehydrogenase [Pseudonocardia sp. SCN 72-51]ODU99860.1 MAG: short-chain dehydrogenase [Pseudonocardia sp. SCN 73-27]